MSPKIQARWAECYERARLACEQNDLQTVETALKQGLDYTVSDGANESDKAQMQFSLGWCYHAQGRLEESYREYLQALECFEKHTGRNSRKVSDVLHNIGSLLSDMGRPSEARRFLLRALEIKRTIKGESHPEVVELQTLLSATEPAPASPPQPAPQPAAAHVHRRRLPRGIVPTQDNLSINEELKKPAFHAQATAAQSPAAALARADRSQTDALATADGSPAVSAEDRFVFFPVSLPKLAIMSFVTFGWYLIGWQYMNWQCADKFNGKKSTPEITVLLVFLFGFILIFPMLLEIHKISKKLGYNRSFPAIPLGLVAVLWAVIPCFLPSPFCLLSCLFFLPLLIVQSYVNDLNSALIPDCRKNDKLTVLNWVAVVIGGLAQSILIALALIALFH